MLLSLEVVQSCLMVRLALMLRFIDLCIILCVGSLKCPDIVWGHGSLNGIDIFIRHGSLHVSGASREIWFTRMARHTLQHWFTRNA